MKVVREKDGTAKVDALPVAKRPAAMQTLSRLPAPSRSAKNMAVHLAGVVRTESSLDSSRARPDRHVGADYTVICTRVKRQV